jgi:hypothetical protein
MSSESDDLRPFDYERHHRELESRFVEYLRGEAAHTLSLETDDYIEAARELQYYLEREGFETTRYEDGNASVVVLAPETFAAALQDAPERETMLNSEWIGGRPASVYGMDVYYSPGVGENELIAIHVDTVVPTTIAQGWKPWLVRHPEAVAVAEVDA